MKSQIKQTPYHGNLFKKLQQHTKSGHSLLKTVEASDIVLSEFEGNEQKMEQIVVRSMQIRTKQLDQPLGFFKSIFASVAKINKAHEFLVFETDVFTITVDYYINNRLVIRMGDRSFVFEQNKSQNRKNAGTLTQKNGLKWKTAFVRNELTVGKLLNYLLLMKMKDFSQLVYNGSHFSREVYLLFQNQFDKQV